MDDGSARIPVRRKSEAPFQVLDAAWLPFTYDQRQDSLTFVHLPRQRQRDTVFLDQRFLAQEPQTSPIPVRHLPIAEVQCAGGPLHFIFHTGFCCSTLLARALDIPGISMGLKEPAIVSFMARLWATLGRRTAAGALALDAVLALLARPLLPGETQVVKASNDCNHIIADVLRARPEARALLLYSDLDAFLRAIVRRGEPGRQFARQTFHQYWKAIPLDLQFTTDDLMLQTDLRMAAHAWLMQLAFMSAVAERFGPQRVRIINSDALLTDKAGAMLRLSEFFDLDLSAPEAIAIANGPTFSEHAKNHGRPFDADDYRIQHAETHARFGDEIAMVLQWAQSLATRANAPLRLPDTLLRQA